MSPTSVELDLILADESKRIDGDIRWQEDEDHSPSMEFRAEVITAAGWPLFVRGSYNPLIPAVTFAMILKSTGRIYALDLGKDHHNPGCDQIGRTHKHRWTELHRDKEAYEPLDITAPPSDPVAVWRQFCAEAMLLHNGNLAAPRPPEGDLFA